MKKWVFYLLGSLSSITRIPIAFLFKVECFSIPKKWIRVSFSAARIGYLHYDRSTGNYLSPRGSLSHQDFCKLFCLAFSAVNRQKSSYFVLVKLSACAGTLFTGVRVCVTTLQSTKKPIFRAIITLLSNNDPRGEQIVVSETVIDMDSGF